MSELTENLDAYGCDKLFCREMGEKSEKTHTVDWKRLGLELEWNWTSLYAGECSCREYRLSNDFLVLNF